MWVTAEVAQYELPFVIRLCKHHLHYHPSIDTMANIDRGWGEYLADYVLQILNEIKIENKVNYV